MRKEQEIDGLPGVRVRLPEGEVFRIILCHPVFPLVLGESVFPLTRKIPLSRVSWGAHGCIRAVRCGAQSSPPAWLGYRHGRAGRRTRPWHQRPHCRTLRSSSMHSCSSQFHVIDGFSPLHPHNNHITTPQWQRLHAVPARMKRCAGPCASASWATAPWMFQRNIPWKRCWPCLPIFFAKARVDKCMNFSAWPLTFPWFLRFRSIPKTQAQCMQPWTIFLNISQARFHLWTVPCLQVTSRSGASAVLQSRRRSWGWTGAWQDLARWASKCSCSCTHCVLIVHVPLRLCLVMISIWIYLSLSRHAGLKIHLPPRPGPLSCTRTLWKRCSATRP